jgi:hypothetical protein
VISSFTYCINNHIMDHESSINYRAFCLLFPKFDWNTTMYILCCLIVIANHSNLYNEQSAPFLIHDLFLGLYQIRVITKLPNSEQSYKGKVKTHNYINRQNQSQKTKNRGEQRSSERTSRSCFTTGTSRVTLDNYFTYFVPVLL